MSVSRFDRVRGSRGRAAGSGFLRPALVLLVLGGPLDVGAVGKAWPAPPSDDEQDLVLLWSDQEGLLARKLTPMGLIAVEREIEAVFLAAGIRVAWAPRAPDATGAGSPNLIFIAVVPRWSEAWGLPRNTMGAVLGEHPRKQALYLFLPNLLAGVGDWSEKKTLRRPGDVQRLSRAVARIVAHEVVHAIDPELRHGDAETIMRADLTPQLLQCDRLAFGPDTATRLRARLSPSRKPFARVVDSGK